MSPQQVLLDHIRTMERIDIQYDLLARESDVIALDFFKAAAAELTASGVMFPSADPEKKGCLVIHYEREKIEKIIVRSNGTITYVGKDIAYNLWKFDLLARDFYYRPFSLLSRRPSHLHDRIGRADAPRAAPRVRPGPTGYTTSSTSASPTCRT